MKNLLFQNIKRTVTLIIALATIGAVSANNIAVSNTSIVAQNTAANYTHVKFDVSWENSWRTSTLESNWDAAYVFVKYRIPPLNTWHHATLNYVDGTAINDGNTEPAGATINTHSDGKGAFLYRNTNGIGNVNFTGARLRWDYGADGLNDADSVEICVFAIETVYVPQGAFYAGDGSVTTVQGQFENGNTGNPLFITGEGQLTLGGSGVGSLGNNNRDGMSAPTYEDFHDGLSKTLPAAFPKGFNAFYCMKYEITQGQYADFLNKLTLTQATARYLGAYNTNGQSITGTHPAFTADAPDRPLMYINYADFLTYLDWSGLRPMTELEYEKACRGARGVGFLPTADEFAWGDVSIKAGPVYLITNPGLPNETINAATTIGNAAYNLTNGVRPYRAGAIAASQATPNRVEAGATYYGIMELSGNQWEFTMSVGRAESRSFNGEHGDGKINAAGVYDVTNWPTYIWGLGMRGGSYDALNYQLRTSSRQYGNYHNINPTRVYSYGGRGVKTAQ
jgi:formylglycine-generating enzyme required for sulfatase activity